MPMAETRRSMTAVMVSRISCSTRSALPWALIFRVRKAAIFCPMIFPARTLVPPRSTPTTVCVFIFNWILWKKDTDCTRPLDLATGSEGEGGELVLRLGYARC